MLMIRFQRIGRKNDAAFRIVVTEKNSGPKSGKHVDLIGSYNPKTKAVSINTDSVKKWMSQGAQVSPSVHNLFIKEGVLSGKKINVLPKKSPILKEVVEEPTKDTKVNKEEIVTTSQEKVQEVVEQSAEQTEGEPVTKDSSTEPTTQEEGKKEAQPSVT